MKPFHSRLKYLHIISSIFTTKTGSAKQLKLRETKRHVPFERSTCIKICTRFATLEISKRAFQETIFVSFLRFCFTFN